ncbi:DUF1127 domain-containing protein [Mesobacterium pallidum]|uniref:DUF1127 domain-containing protein n=1 Tax=Mesobacterium pallidum TaxID=2872037 RepID=UPI001EE2A00E|nr:DUF1127 domain-containing protein [Mesobacterium pallidum]
MSPQHALHPAFADLYDRSHALPVVARLALAVAVKVETWDRTRRTRQALKQLEPWQLHDVGLTPDMVNAELRRRGH